MLKGMNVERHSLKDFLSARLNRQLRLMYWNVDDLKSNNSSVLESQLCITGSGIPRLTSHHCPAIRHLAKPGDPCKDHNQNIALLVGDIVIILFVGHFQFPV